MPNPIACTSCGTIAAPMAKYCGRCGTPISRVMRTQPAPSITRGRRPTARFRTCAPAASKPSSYPPVAHVASPAASGTDRPEALPPRRVWIFVAVAVGAGIVGWSTAYALAHTWIGLTKAHYVRLNANVHRFDVWFGLLAAPWSIARLVAFGVPTMAGFVFSRLRLQQGRTGSDANWAAFACLVPFAVLVISGLVQSAYVAIGLLVALIVFGTAKLLNPGARRASRAAAAGTFVLIALAAVAGAFRLSEPFAYYLPAYDVSRFSLESSFGAMTSTLPVLAVGLVDALTGRLPRRRPAPALLTAAAAPGGLVPIYAADGSIVGYAPVGSPPMVGAGASGPGFRPRFNGFAIAGFVLSFFSGTVITLVFCFVGLSQIKNSGGIQRGRGLAIAGVVIACIEVAACLAFWIALAVAANSSPY